MALCEVSDYPNEFEQFKAGVNYGFAVPTQYPIGISGLGLSINPLTTGTYANLDFNPTPPNTDYTLPSKSDSTTNVAKSVTPNASTGITPGSFADQTQQFLNVLTPFIAQGAAAFQKNRKAPKRVVVEQKQDYTQLALIGGGILVAALLAISIGKSGRRKD
jgi:hypothetical protein